MTTKTIAAEEYLCQLQLEILRLREVVSGLYRAGEDRQNDVFYRYENLLNCNALLMDEAYVQPIYNATNLFCYNSGYTNIIMDAGGAFYVKDFQLAA